MNEDFKEKCMHPHQDSIKMKNLLKKALYELKQSLGA